MIERIDKITFHLINIEETAVRIKFKYEIKPSVFTSLFFLLEPSSLKLVLAGTHNLKSGALDFLSSGEAKEVFSKLLQRDKIRMINNGVNLEEIVKVNC